MLARSGLERASGMWEVGFSRFLLPRSSEGVEMMCVLRTLSSLMSTHRTETPERAGTTLCAFVESVINLSVVRPRDVGDRNGFHHGTTYPFADESSGRGSEMASFGFKWQNLAKREPLGTMSHRRSTPSSLPLLCSLLGSQLHQAREFESAATEYFNQQRPYLITNQHTL
uniref:Uncharacterized protein n=1 Tax=Anopheles merus TaxID=30066 RepID=A0A182UQ03_ANOME